MSRDFRRRRHNGSHTSFKTYVLISVICCLVVLGVQAFVKLTEDTKETMDSAVQGAIRKAVDAEIKEPINKYR